MVDFIEYAIEKSWDKFNPKLTRVALEVMKRVEEEMVGVTNFQNGFNKCWLFMQILYFIDQETPMNLPYYWYKDGVVVDPEALIKTTNGIIKFIWDNNCIGCQIEKECPCLGNPHLKDVRT